MLEFKNIRKSFSGVEVLHDISFQIYKGKVIALVGENGAGKSTLMKILSGILTEYQGTIYLDEKKSIFTNPGEAEKAGISIIHQELNLIPDLSVGENIFLGREPVTPFRFVIFRELFKKATDILEEFDFPYPPKTKVKNLSVGWRQMTEIARTLNINSDIIIMDEPTSALSDTEIKILFDKIRLLKDKGKTIIYISHRMNEIFDIADEIFVLRDGYFIGHFDKNQITKEQLISLMIGKKLLKHKKRNTEYSSETVLKMEDVNISNTESDILSNLSFDLKRGQVLGVGGLLGSGRTELLKFLFGAFKANYVGTIKLNEENYYPQSPNSSISAGIIYLSEDRKHEGIFSSMGILENSSISILKRLLKYGFINRKRENQKVSFKTSELNVKMRSLNQKIDTLSGGNQQKVLLSRILLIEPKILLLDEPTRGIDVGAKQEIYELIDKLRNEGLSIIITSSEIPELLLMTDKILVLSQGKQTALLNTIETDSQEILYHASTGIKHEK